MLLHTGLLLTGQQADKPEIVALRPSLEIAINESRSVLLDKILHLGMFLASGTDCASIKEKYILANSIQYLVASRLHKKLPLQGTHSAWLLRL